MEEIKKKIEAYLATRPYMNLATIKSDGAPAAHTVGYANDGAVVYFMTHRDTRKLTHIKNNPKVAFTIDEDCLELPKIQGVQMEGTATVLSEKADIEKAGGLLGQKFGEMEIPFMDEMVFVKVEPTEAYFIDNTQGFGHRDNVTY